MRTKTTIPAWRWVLLAWQDRRLTTTRHCAWGVPSFERARRVLILAGLAYE